MVDCVPVCTPIYANVKLDARGNSPDEPQPVFAAGGETSLSEAHLPNISFVVDLLNQFMHALHEIHR